MASGNLQPWQFSRQKVSQLWHAGQSHQRLVHLPKQLSLATHPQRTLGAGLLRSFAGQDPCLQEKVLHVG
jgi:predicted RNA binding protein YcfA (HicA-like mRNA interferase family)